MKGATDSKHNYSALLTELRHFNLTEGVIFEHQVIFRCFIFFRRRLRISYFLFSKAERKPAATQEAILCIKAFIPNFWNTENWKEP